MNRTVRWVASVWLIIAVLLAIGSSVGGDTSIECGFLWLIWTAPIGMIWAFWIYDEIIKFIPVNVANYGGLVAVLIADFAFWFYLAPLIFRAVRRRSNV